MPRNKKNTAAKRKSGSRETGAKVKGKASKKTAKIAKAASKPQPQQTSAGSNRAQGIAMFKLAGRPTKEQFILVYGEAGPRMTWEQRGAAGVPAERFPQALAEKAVSRRTGSK